ncbi:MAG: extracellular solute-binding protein [Anaerolineae bacterium]
MRRLGWPFLTSVLFATSLMSAIFRGVTGPSVVVLAVLFLLAVALVILPRVGPAKIRRLVRGVWAHPWPILSGIFFLSTLTLLIGRAIPSERIVFVVDLADQEMMVFREILDDLEPELGADIFLMPVDSSRHVARLDKMVASGTMRWDLVAVDNNMLGILVAKGLVDELSKYIEYDELVPRTLLPAIRPLLQFEDRLYFAPFHPNVKVTFYNQQKFAQYGLKPPKNWDDLIEVARVFKKREGVGRVAIQGYPGRTSALTVFEFVKAAGGNPLTLDDSGSWRAFTFLQELEPYLATEHAEVSFDTANELLIDDEVYLVSNWTYGIKVVIEEAEKKDIKVYSGWSGPEREVHVLGGDVLAIPKDAPHPDKAIKLIELLLSIDAQKTLSRLRWLPVRVDAYDRMPSELVPHFRAVDESLSLAVARPTVPQ